VKIGLGGGEQRGQPSGKSKFDSSDCLLERWVGSGTTITVVQGFASIDAFKVGRILVPRDTTD